MPQEVGGAQREVEPPAAEADPAGPGTPLQLEAGQRTQVAPDVRPDRRVQSVATQIDGLPVDDQRTGQATHRGGPVEHDRRESPANRVPGGGESGRPGAEHHHIAVPGNRDHAR